MAIVKSKLIKQLKKSYPNFLTRDLEKLVSIITNEIKLSLKRGERVELRGFGIFQPMYKKQEFQETQKLVKKSTLLKKKQFTSKCLKICLKQLNNEKE